MPAQTVPSPNIRLDVFIASQSPEWPRAQIKQAIEAGQVMVNGDVCTKAGRKLSVGELVSWDEPEKQPDGEVIAQENIDFRMVYEDEHLLVIDKPAGLVVHPGAGHRDGTLINGILAKYPEIAQVGEPDRPGIVHRLDAETSGLLLIARSQAAYEKLTAMFAKHEITRQYWAICYAPKLPDSGRFDTPYGRHPTQRVKFSSRFEAEKRAITNFRVLDKNGNGFVLVTCLLETGRTHQVRVHLSDHGAPILGDSLYAPDKIARHKAISRLALHAGKLEFMHPILGTLCQFESPFPADFCHALETLHLSMRNS
ncbi:MAG: RluA family pseudouridine synthase [Proteobacteria bacterium]|nr:RluA family pseudouridine synthase [Pseudomonadota bacterium]